MSDPHFNVLLVEDNPGDARLVRESLAESGGGQFDLETADRLTTALSRLGEGGIDAILLDLALPDSKGHETFERAKNLAPTVPIIILTGLGDEALALKMVREGAQDYVAKVNLNGNLLVRAIRYAIERERAEQQIRRFNEELEIRVRQRTAELEAANNELELFSYSFSHHLSAPLRHIDGYSNILLEMLRGQSDPQPLKYVERICNAVDRMSGMIDALTELGRCGRRRLRLQTTDLNELVEDVLDRLKPEVSTRKIDWKVGSLPSVECDRDLMDHVFSNLLGNSIKSTRPRETAVIEVGQTVKDGQGALFVRDNGIGFDMKGADKLFGAFQCLHPPEEFEGTGIGLATVQRIVHKHGGRVWAEAEPDRGAIFYFTIPPTSKF
jgi:signal transduction histidine kinase